MAPRPLLFRLALTTKVGRLNTKHHNEFKRSLRLSATKPVPTDVMSSSAATNQTVQQTHQVLLLADEAKNAAFLGEADSNDGHDVYRDTYGAPQPALDASYAAFLGEADSDDGLEARKIEEGDKHEPLDAKYAAFLGEADSDDGFEADVEANPAKYDHKIHDTSESGFHAEGGELR